MTAGHISLARFAPAFFPAVPDARRPVVLLLALALLVVSGLPAQAETKRIGPKMIEADALRIVNFIGAVQIEVGPSGNKIEVLLEGQARLLEDIALRREGKQLVVEREKDWLDFPEQQLYEWRDTFPKVTLRVPAGTPVTLDGVVGKARIGNIAAPLILEASLLEAEVGDVSEARLALFGRGDVTIGKIAGRLDANLSGSSDLTIGDAGEVVIEKSGSGDIVLGAIGKGLSYDSTGSGDSSAASVTGPVDVRISGSGNLYLKGGEAEPLTLRITGSGDFRFDGTAVDPDVTINGSGSVRIHGHRGTLRLRSFSGAVVYSERGGISIAQ